MAGLDLPAGVVVDAIEDPLCIVDGDDHIVMHNDAFAEFADDSNGETVTEMLGDCPALETAISDRTGGTVPIDSDGECYYQVEISAVEDASRELTLVLCHDVTDQHRRREELERENERLDQFASVISHDLRNPLDVALGRATVIGELVDNPEVETHVGEIKAAQTRMNRIIQDVLTLAREGQSIDEKQVVDLATVADDAWTHVETDSVRLDVRTDRAVLADPDRLEQIFENLFRNCVEHGSTDDSAAGDGGEPASDPLTITVGSLTERSGFYLADTGPGIDPAERDRIFEPGFSGDEEGTGLGLAIVSNIAEAHGWKVGVTASAANGARFEFSGVEFAE